MAADPVFVDTNVPGLCDTTNGFRARRRSGRVGPVGREGRALWISFPILREYLATATRPLATSLALPMGTAIADVRRFQQVFYVAEDSPAVLDRLLALLGAHFGAGRQVHDTNIVATMLGHGIYRLLTFNAADFRRFAGIIQLEPPQ
jgi:predicted nucleic acid-binding protein